MKVVLTRKRGLAMRAQIGTFSTPFPQLAGLISPGTYEARETPWGRRRPFLTLHRCKGSGLNRAFDMENYILDMADPIWGGLGMLPFSTHIALCTDALKALFSNYPNTIYVYKLNPKKKEVKTK